MILFGRNHIFFLVRVLSLSVKVQNKIHVHTHTNIRCWYPMIRNSWYLVLRLVLMLLAGVSLMSALVL